MGLKERIRRELKLTTAKFDRALCRFDPAPGRTNTYPERMVSYYYIRALAKALRSADVFLEIPVTGKSKRGWDNHIDALIFNDREAVVAEFKVAWEPGHWGALARDLKRLRSASVAKEIRECFAKAECVAPRQRRSFIFLGADCWYRERAEAWKSGKRVGNWILPKSLLASKKRDYFPVYCGEGSGYDGYYFTWALFEFPKLEA